MILASSHRPSVEAVQETPRAVAADGDASRGGREPAACRNGSGGLRGASKLLAVGWFLLNIKAGRRADSLREYVHPIAPILKAYAPGPTTSNKA